MGWYKDWFGTRYYALLYGHRDDADAGAWVDTIVERSGARPGAHVLDLACGRGRHAWHFVDRGMRVTGIDIAESSIAEAREAVPGADFRVQDMRVAVEPGTYDGACCLFTSLGYFDSKADDQQVFDAVASALRPGGFFVVDFMNTRRVLRELVREEELQLGEVRFHISRSVDAGIVVKCITVYDGEDVHRYTERVQALDHEELEDMARKAGLEVIDRTDGPVPIPFDPERSHRFVLWTRKPLV